MTRESALLHDADGPDVRLRHQRAGDGADPLADVEGRDEDDRREEDADGDVPLLEQHSQAHPRVAAAAEQPEKADETSLRGLSAADLAEAVREIKQYVHAEIEALKNEISALQDQLQ